MGKSDEQINSVEVEESFDGMSFEEPVATEEIVSNNEQVNNVEVDESFDAESFEIPATTKDVAVITEEDLGELSLGDANEEYEQHQTEKKIAPVVQKVTKQAVSEAVKYQQDKFKVEVEEVLQDEVGYRLDKYEKRRRRRDVKDKLGVVMKWVVVVGIIAFIYGTPQLRTKFAILFRDFGELVEGLINGKEVSSNKLVEDALTGLGEDLNENSGFSLESEESGISEDLSEAVSEVSEVE